MVCTNAACHPDDVSYLKRVARFYLAARQLATPYRLNFPPSCRLNKVRRSDRRRAVSTFNFIIHIQLTKTDSLTLEDECWHYASFASLMTLQHSYEHNGAHAIIWNPIFSVENRSQPNKSFKINGGKSNKHKIKQGAKNVATTTVVFIKMVSQTQLHLYKDFNTYQQHKIPSLINSEKAHTKIKLLRNFWAISLKALQCLKKSLYPWPRMRPLAYSLPTTSILTRLATGAALRLVPSPQLIKTPMLLPPATTIHKPREQRSRPCRPPKLAISGTCCAWGSLTWRRQYLAFMHGGYNCKGDICITFKIKAIYRNSILLCTKWDIGLVDAVVGKTGVWQTIQPNLRNMIRPSQ